MKKIMHIIITFFTCSLVLLAMALPVALIGGCTVNQKYVEVNLDEESCLIVSGDIDPRFMREGTTESQTQTTDAKASLPITIPLVP